MPAEIRIKTSEILEGTIRRIMYKHSECIVKLNYLREQSVNRFILEGIIKIIDEKENLLFKGVIQDINITHAFDEFTVILYAVSATVKMDTKARLHTYQSMSREEIINLILKEYGGKAVFNYPSQQIKQKISCIQRMESDWEFIIRLACSTGDKIWAEHTENFPKIYVDGQSAAKYRDQYIVFRDGKITDNNQAVEENMSSGGYVPVLYQAARASYFENPVPAGWTVMESSKKEDYGYGYLVLKKNNNIIISYQGSNDILDFTYDVIGPVNNVMLELTYDPVIKGVNTLAKMAAPNLLGQDLLAKKTFYEQLKKYPSAKFYLVGHSLGGHLALETTLDAIETGNGHRIAKVELFNALGASNIAGTISNHSILKSKVHHHMMRFDPVGPILPKGGKKTLYYKRFLFPHSIDLFEDCYIYKKNNGLDNPGFMNQGKTGIPLEKQPCRIGLSGRVLESSDSYIKMQFNEDRVPVTVENACRIKIISVYFNNSKTSGIYIPPDKGSYGCFHFPYMTMDSGILVGLCQQPVIEADNTRIVRKIIR